MRETMIIHGLWNTPTSWERPTPEHANLGRARVKLHGAKLTHRWELIWMDHLNSVRDGSLINGEFTTQEYQFARIEVSVVWHHLHLQQLEWMMHDEVHVILKIEVTHESVQPRQRPVFRCEHTFVSRQVLFWKLEVYNLKNPAGIDELETLGP